MFLLVFTLLCLSVAGRGAAATSHVVINEFDQDPSTDQRYVFDEWAELFNPTAQAIDLSGWQLIANHTGFVYTIPAGTIIHPQEYVIIQPGEQVWLHDVWELIILKDPAGSVIDKTKNATDPYNNELSWQRFPNGQDTDTDVDWVFLTATRGFSNGGESVTTTTTTSLTTATSTTQQQVTTQTTTQQMTTATTEHTTTVTTVGPSSDMGWGFAIIGIGVGVACAGGGVAAALSGRQYPQVFTYDGYYYCMKHRVPVWYIQGHLWCPVDRRYLRY
jgi:hypothetical protein